MQRLLAFGKKTVIFLQKTIACGRVIERERGSKTAPFTLSPPGLPAFLADFSILQQSLFWTPCRKAALRPKGDLTCSGEVNPPCAKVLLRKTLVTPHLRRSITWHL